MDARWTFLFGASATVPACFDGTRGELARRPPRELVRPASSQRYIKPSKRRRACLLLFIKHETLLSEGGASSSFDNAPVLFAAVEQTHAFYNNTPMALMY